MKNIFYSKISLAMEKKKQQNVFSVYIYDDKTTNLKDILESIARKGCQKGWVEDCKGLPKRITRTDCQKGYPERVSRKDRRLARKGL